MHRALRFIISIVSFAVGLIAIGYNTYLLTNGMISRGSRFAYLALGLVMIIAGLYFSLSREPARPRRQGLPKICNVDDVNALPDLSSEQLHIMQRLFRDDFRVHVMRLSGGYSNFGVFWIVRERRQGDKLDEVGFVVKYSDVKDIRNEMRIHRKGGLLNRYPLPYTPGTFLGSWPSGDELEMAPDHMIGAVYYHLATLEQGSRLRTLAEIYHQHSFEDIEPYLVSLFDERLLPWYQQGSYDQVKPLAGINGEYERLYRNRGRIQENMSSLLSIPHQELSDREQISFSFLPELWAERTYYNPIYWILNVLVLDEAECFQARCQNSPVHGDLHSANILIEQGKGNTNIWLIDFPDAHIGPAVVDFATLEADVKYNLLSEKHCSMEEWLEFEEKLLAPLERPHEITFVAPWHRRWKPENPHLCQAWEFIGFLRERIVASNLMGGDVRAYYLALLYATLPVVYRHHTEFQKQCALTSAAWMCEHLNS